ncbi:histidine kinase [Desulfococcus multivorans]|uniref:histidine kinase n=3 Tax=Desulfococcus TaxID=896 RepID=S7TMD4_DESML|nr:histidine kinase [Desulfococcus multivorans]EPR37875.1 integral membrane sensor signal transduction histidine kinase [Desulfococcus multivorans DSM 2059]SKA16281.1 His Kinase A (phospho-acceptor) domain-containing protein [Desulfococcus multivorans DSM 2059]
MIRNGPVQRMMEKKDAMWHRLNLSFRIHSILAVLLLITLFGGVVMVWYTYRMDGILTDIIDKDTAAFETAQELETALVNQKGFVSYYFLDGNPDWLRQLGEYRQIFKTLIGKARLVTVTADQEAAIERIAAAYQQYVLTKDQVIDYYLAGDRETGGRLHAAVREHFFKVLDLCEEFKALYKKEIQRAKRESQEQARQLRVMAILGMVMVFLCGVFLAVLLMKHVLEPVRELTRMADRRENISPRENEIKALSRTVHGLIEDVDFTHSELEKSREHLLQSEKMAMVGKLATGMAHTIRNPFTSIKMRLFSLSRTLELDETEKEDFDVIAEEIRHVDTIVQNFLEFSRPPKLRMQHISPSQVVDTTFQLLAHRLRSYDVAVKIVREEPLPSVEADPEQLKEVFVNLIINACEAIGTGRNGKITVHETTTADAAHGRKVIIRINDNGPGIPEAIRQKIFQPFFTTKDEGTGLGLSIAYRIIGEHRGRLEVHSVEGEGATFIITLPVCDRPDHQE